MEDISIFNLISYLSLIKDFKVLGLISSKFKAKMRPSWWLRLSVATLKVSDVI